MSQNSEKHAMRIHALETTYEGQELASKLFEELGRAGYEGDHEREARARRALERMEHGLKCA